MIRACVAEFRVGVALPRIPLRSIRAKVSGDNL